MAHKITSLDDYPTSFKISLADRMRAAAGLPAHMRRKRRIEDLEEAIVAALSQIFDEAEAEFGVGSPQAEEAFGARARDLDLGLLNDLIDRHNRYYPIEANLPTDVTTGKLMLGSQPWAPDPMVTHDHFIARVRELRKG